MIALVLAGGPVRVDDRLRALAAEAGLVVAADGGLRHATSLGVTPDLLVGDLDSVREEDLDAWPDLPREVHPPAKDALDLELAIEAALLRGADQVRVIGSFGGRFDQTLGTALIAARYAREGVRIALLDGIHDAHPVVAGAHLDAPLPEGTLFSLLSIGGPARVDVSGAAYPLSDALLAPGVGLGLSNRAAGGPSVRVREGLVLVIVEWEADAGQEAPDEQAGAAPDAPHAGTATADRPAPGDPVVDAGRRGEPTDGAALHPKHALWGEDAERIERSLRAIDDDLADLVVNGAYGDVFARPGLDHRTRSLLAIAHLTALGSEREIRTHVRALLRQGGTLAEAKEAILHAAMFVGFPRALAAMRGWAAERDRED